ncbi:NAD(P)/FAD-dependent oxidoreductase [Solwaraspora sp. WMMD1047]|uniref:flavin-containing monooxygenase n=1 Tax=Solwaraspora sp. WMMD1047 TaxID=3016102 RepID=UPI0024167214|nr:NAD(P)/FAD-dependent oxidoreductase [Solwaraspora sp. WMMD1047]MDG4834227.1 NAD(P)/FAD-dependent oxidoreductase [Solwaraspora sp. WMMD1047]
MDADVVVLGGGQAGLAMGHALRGSGLRVVILEAGMAVGDVWRSRWDSLRLFTPAGYSGLPGLPFPGARGRHPGKDEVAAYLADYAACFALPVRLDVEVRQVSASNTAAGFDVVASDGVYRAGQVVVATGPFQFPTVPEFAGDLDDGVVQLHSHDYRNPEQLPDEGPTAVVGRGNSGAQIAAELAAAGRRVIVSGRDQQYLPQRVAGRDIFWWLHRLNLLHAPTGSWRARLLRRRGEPVIGTNLRELAGQGLLGLRARASGAHGKVLEFEDGRREQVAGVVWATGYRSGYPWLRLPVLDEDGQPVHDRGVTQVPGLYFLGLPWLSQRGSALLDGVGTDAARLASGIIARARRISRPSGQDR